MLFAVACSPSTSYYRASVSLQGEGGLGGRPDIEVRLTIDGEIPLTSYTDSTGLVVFSVPSHFSGKAARLEAVPPNGYYAESRWVEVSFNSMPERLYLSQVENQVAHPSPAGDTSINIVDPNSGAVYILVTATPAP